MKKFEIFDNNGEQLSPVTKMSAVMDEENKVNLKDIVDSKDSSVAMDEAFRISTVPTISPVVRSMMEALIVNTEGYIINSDGWVLNEETELYEYDIEDEASKNESITTLYLDTENTEIAMNFDLLSYTESFDGYIKLFSKLLPNADIVCDYNITTSLQDVVGSPSSSAITTELKSEIAQIKEKISTSTNTVDILVKDWILNEDNGFYEATIKDENCSVDSLVSMKILLEYLAISNQAEVYPYVYNYDKYFKLISKTQPSDDIQIEYTIRK